MLSFNTRIKLIVLFISCCSVMQNALQQHETWWTINTHKIPETLSNWLGDAQANSRIFIREYLQKTSYITLLDIPCGTCIDYLAFSQYNPFLKYTGLDITEPMVKQARALGANAHIGSIENIPFDDSSFDVAYTRHLLEHLSYYTKAVSELIRVAKHEAIVIFFIIPTCEPDEIKLTEDRDAMLYHNHYNKDIFEAFILTHKKVKEIRWDNLGNTECGQEAVAHIYMQLDA